MKVLLIGKGGREHAMAWKLRRSPHLTKLFVWPGNPVINRIAEPLKLTPAAPYSDVISAALAAGVDLVVVGPEQPLSEGFADQAAARNLPVFGPRQAAAQLESSKEFAKKIMKRATIPTAAFSVAASREECHMLAARMLKDQGGAVIKASGLAAGKGVFVCQSERDIENALGHLYDTEMVKAAERVVVEEVLKGRECSFFAFVGPDGATPIGFAVDFKRLSDGDCGPNTGGMGCYAPAAWLPENAAKTVMDKVVHPLLKALAAEGIAYCGCLYVGLMWSMETGPSVVEFNVRLGDPEAQVLAVYDDRDWLALMAHKAGLKVDAGHLAAAVRPLSGQERAVAVVMASEGYPYGGVAEQPVHLDWRFFNDDRPDLVTFAASVSADGNGVRTGSGRVLTAVAKGLSFHAARERVYTHVAEIGAHWREAKYRTDIARRVATESD